MHIIVWAACTILCSEFLLFPLLNVLTPLLNSVVYHTAVAFQQCVSGCTNGMLH